MLLDFPLAHCKSFPKEHLIKIITFEFFRKAIPWPLLWVSGVCSAFQVDVTDTEDEEKRYSLFVELLEASHREVEFQHLALLLQAWPPVKREYT